MKFKLIIDNQITIEKEIKGNFKSFNIKTEVSEYKFGDCIDDKSILETMSEDELEDLFDDSFFRF